jgi:glycerol-3-phosphate acyltransferase PlsY
VCIGAFAGAVWLLIAKGLKISSLAALIAMALAPIFVWFWSASLEWTVGVTLMSIILIWRHKSNITRLLSGEEQAIGR